MHRTPKIVALVCIASAGLAAAVALTFPPSSLAWSINNLPAGFTTFVRSDISGGPCPLAYRIEYVPTVTASSWLCTDSPTFQQDLDAFVNANYTAPAATTSTAATTAQTTTTSPGTTTSPPATSTDTTTAPVAAAPAAAAPSAAAPSAPASTTATDPTVTVTTTVTTTVTDPTVNKRLSDLEQKYAALAARVDAIAQANTASWDAYIAAVNAGASNAEAAAAARSAGLNAIYQLAL